MDPNVKDSIVARLKEATNVLVTVSNNPTVDQLAACIGFTLLLNKVGKRGAAVFSGKVPSTLEFLQPDKTIEKNTDSLRDFIIALDKSKADKLRYKVEDKVVKIFITPYRTSISDKDLDFSQGDFNVDVVLALGVHEKSELDQAIVSHGRILHDATVISVNNKDQGNVGTLNWVDLQSSSLSEMMASIGQQLSSDAFDNQIATALMTGIVAETDRFSNEKTTPATMKLASDLMGAGANQQLIAAKLEEPNVGSSASSKKTKDEDGELSIPHENSEDSEDKTKTEDAPEEKSADKEEKEEFELPKPSEIQIEVPEIDEPEEPENPPEEKPAEPENPEPPTSRISQARSFGANPQKPVSMTLDPPKMGGKLTANSEPEHLTLDPSTDPMSVGASRLDNGILSRSGPPRTLAPLPGSQSDENKTPESPISSTTPVPPTPPVPDLPPLEDKPAEKPAEPTPPAEEVDEAKVDDARNAVEQAIQEGGDPEKNLEPIQAIGSQPVNLDLRKPEDANLVPPPPPAVEPSANPNPLPPLTPPTGPAFAPGPDVSMPPNLNNTPPPPPPSPSADLNTFVNPSVPLPPPPNPLTPPGLVPNGSPTDQSGSSGPATPPPPVPPPFNPTQQ